MLDPQDRASCLLSSTLARCSLSISCFFASPSSSYTRTPRCASSSRLLYSCIFPSSSRWGLRAPGPVLTWAIGEEEEDPSFDAPDCNASARLSIAAVASAAEMVPGVILQPRRTRMLHRLPFSSLRALRRSHVPSLKVQEQQAQQPIQNVVANTSLLHKPLPHLGAPGSP